MIGYLIKRIIFLVIFLAAIIVMPFAAMIGMIIYFVVEGVRQVKSANEDLSLGFYGTFFFVIGGIAVMFMGLFIMDKITENPVWTELFAVVAFSATLIIGGRASINFVRTDRAYYFMNEVVEKLTAPYPYLLITAGIVRIVIEVIR
ncbi:MAG: hypothetical protein IJW66_06065, partial [Clostridia bacterium]|nr:hypothetical protein [Clostridia bacterium]